MRTLNRNKRKMFYAQYLGKTPEYETDINGNLIVVYTEKDGTVHYKETGNMIDSYSKPVEFYGNISLSGGQSVSTEYGFDISKYSAVLVMPKGSLPLTETSLIWFENAPISLPTGNADSKSADYRVVKVSPSINIDKYILQKVVK